MALDEEDRQEIAAMIAEGSKGSRRPESSRRPSPPAGSDVSSDDWDGMSSRQRETYIRDLVEEKLSALDAEVEREELRRENDELRAKVKEWEKQGRPGRRPTKATLGDGKPEENAPTLVNKVYKFIFGEPNPGR